MDGILYGIAFEPILERLLICLRFHGRCACMCPCECECVRACACVNVFAIALRLYECVNHMYASYTYTNEVKAFQTHLCGKNCGAKIDKSKPLNRLIFFDAMWQHQLCVFERHEFSFQR